MAEFEYGYCEFADFYNHQSDRVAEQDLVIGGIYIAMFAVDAPAEYPAARFPTCVSDLVVEAGEPSAVRFRLLTPKLLPFAELRSYFQDGYWLPVRSERIVIDEVDATTGYFLDSEAIDHAALSLQGMVNAQLPALI